MKANLSEQQFRQHIALICALTLGIIIGFCGMQFVARTGAISDYNACLNDQGTSQACKTMPPVPKGTDGKPVPVVDVR